MIYPGWGTGWAKTVKVDGIEPTILWSYLCSTIRPRSYFSVYWEGHLFSQLIYYVCDWAFHFLISLAYIKFNPEKVFSVRNVWLVVDGEIW